MMPLLHHAYGKLTSMMKNAACKQSTKAVPQAHMRPVPISMVTSTGQRPISDLSGENVEAVLVNAPLAGHQKKRA